jgi:hypothetical protein
VRGAGLSRFRLKSSGSAAALLLSAALSSGLAAASEPVRLEYRVPPGADCPSEAVFVERVRERSVHHRAAAPGELARSFAVTVTLDEEGALARVDFVDPDGSAISRSVRGANCDEVVSGIALVAALAIDARAGEAPSPSPAPSAPPAEPKAPAPAPPPPKPLPRPSGLTPKYTAGLGGGWVSYGGPSGALLLDAFFAASLAERGPVARLSAIHLRSELASADGREGRLRVYGGRLEACPVSFPLRPFFLEPCAGTGVGVLLSSGVPSLELPEASDKAQLWWDLVVIGRLGAVIEDRVVLEVQGEFGVPLSRPSFGFDNNQANPIFEVPRVGGSARGGVGIRFP